MIAAIKNTLLAMNLNPELVDAYLEQAGEIGYAANHDRKMTAQLNRQGLEAAFAVGDAVNDSGGRLKFEDALGSVVSRVPVNYSNSYADIFVPSEKMVEALAELTAKPAYRYRACELLVTLNLQIYRATRRLIVPADITLARLHRVLQKAFSWKNYHLYNFAVFDDNNRIRTHLVSDEEALEYGNTALVIDAQRLSDYLPQHQRLLYTYDLGDCWEHEVTLVRVIEAHDTASPCLLAASGQTPPEDVGGIGGFIAFREIIANPDHLQHTETKAWAGYWSPELAEWEARPRIID